METVVEINGLPVKFSDQKPTKPGAYWYSVHHELTPMLMHVHRSNGGELYVPGEGRLVHFSGIGLWSAPLVPVTEVEKAHKEGFLSAHHTPGYSIKTAAIEAYEKSNARKVVEGPL